MRETSRQSKRRTLVFLGDYVDRGPDSRGVVETLIGGLPHGFERISSRAITRPSCSISSTIPGRSTIG